MDSNGSKQRGFGPTIESRVWWDCVPPDSTLLSRVIAHSPIIAHSPTRLYSTLKSRVWWDCEQLCACLNACTHTAPTFEMQQAHTELVHESAAEKDTVTRTHLFHRHNFAVEKLFIVVGINLVDNLQRNSFACDARHKLRQPFAAVLVLPISPSSLEAGRHGSGRVRRSRLRVRIEMKCTGGSDRKKCFLPTSAEIEEKIGGK